MADDTPDRGNHRIREEMRYTRLGIALCVGLKEEARMLTSIFEAKGFEVASVNCKVGRIPKEDIGLAGDEKIMGPDIMEPMCNSIAQAEVLNAEQVDLAVMLGLCVGHDTLFIKYCNVPCTVLAVKDRVLGHNPLAALYFPRGPTTSGWACQDRPLKESPRSTRSESLRSSGQAPCQLPRRWCSGPDA